MSEDVLTAPAVAAPKRDFIGEIRNSLLAFSKTANFWPTILIIVAFTACFWNLFAEFPELWFGGDGYYSHGVLVPLISGYIIFKAWPKIKDREVKPFPLAAIGILLLGWVHFAATIQGQIQASSVAFVLMLACSVLFVAGWRWLAAVAAPILYLFFAMPVLGNIIDTYTNPLQQISSKIAFSMLQVLGFNPFEENSTTVHLPNFTLDVGVPCSGLKLLIAVTAFCVFFMLIGNLKWWANLMMVAFIIPLCLFINGLRIAMIGIVGSQYGSEAGHQFHDYSGYIGLLICFFILFKFARWLGWKD